MASVAKDHQRLDPSIERFWNVKQLADYLGFTRSSIERWVATDYIPTHRVGEGARKNVRFKKSEIDAWMLAKSRFSKGRLTIMPSNMATPASAL